MLRDQNRGSVVEEGTGSTYESAETFSRKFFHHELCQNVENISYTYPGRKHDSLELYAEKWEGKDIQN